MAGPPFKHKKGDFVRLTRYRDKEGKPFEHEWERLIKGYNLYHDIPYEIVGHTDYHPLIKSTDPTREINFTFAVDKDRSYKNVIDWEDSHMELDEEYLKEKLKKLFG